MLRLLKLFYHPLRSRLWKKHVLAPELAGPASIAHSLASMRSRWPDSSTDEVDAPIFLLSAGWGSGSTLLQRLIMSDESTLLWGEPLDHAVPVARLAQIVLPFDDLWPRDAYFRQLGSAAPLKDQWIANLTPPTVDLKRAHRAFLRDWLKAPAVAAGKERWGFKEVRLTADHARYLQWLFPRARFVLLYRDVINSWASCRHVKWLSVWPDHKVGRPSAFAHHWRHLVESFLSAQKELDAFVVRYEDLVAKKVDLDQLAAYLGTGPLDQSVLDLKLGARSEQRAAPTLNERAVIHGITDDLRAELGYG